MPDPKKPAEQYIRECLSLAAPLRGRTFPNPLVGCVIVRNGKVLGRGVHKGPGTAHAEVLALKEAGIAAKGATLYVNLEPCCHYGNTPPCTDAIIKAGIKEVVFSIKDPNPLVKKINSEKILQKAGILVIKGILVKEARQLNEKFLKFHETGRSFVSLKLAASLDGKIATSTGKSKWITGVASREVVQLLRREADAIAVGVNTIIKDDPSLTIKPPLPNGRTQPLRVVFDSKLRIPLTAKVLTLKAKGSTLIFTTTDAPPAQKALIEHHGAEVHVLKKDDHGHVDLREAVTFLAERQITSILIEGGGEIAASAIEAGIVDKLYYFIAPLVIGGKNSIPAVGGTGAKKLQNVFHLKDMTFRQVGEDLLVEGHF
jgi:diaminohydroxyphosphoribosylaminopyrimidine deaminase/5-amino-6-(5-phosphoribosylamino)uracil reductase